MLHGLDEGRLAVVSGMVVGERNGVEAPVQDGQRARFGTEGGDRSFEVADAIVSLRENFGERGQRIAASGNRAAWTDGQHDVAGEDQGEALSLGCSGKHEKDGDLRGRPEEVADFHGAALSSHQYCSSPSRSGS